MKRCPGDFGLSLLSTIGKIRVFPLKKPRGCPHGHGLVPARRVFRRHRGRCRGKKYEFNAHKPLFSAVTQTYHDAERPLSACFHLLVFADEKNAFASAPRRRACIVFFSPPSPRSRSSFSENDDGKVRDFCRLFCTPPSVFLFGRVPTVCAKPP